MRHPSRCGAFICPEGAACFAAVRRLRAPGWLAEHDEVAVLNTGTGLKYPGTAHGGAAGETASR